MADATVGSTELREQGRAAYRRRVWSDAFACLSRADEISPLEAADLDLLAVVARLTGRDAAADDYAARCYEAWLRIGQPRPAARRAAWLSLQLLLRGQDVPCRAWSARADRLLREVGSEPLPERGFLMIISALSELAGGQPRSALQTHTEITELGRRFAEPDLIAIGQLGQGEALASLGRVREAMTKLDEAMLAVTTKVVTPEAGGIVYCAVIEACEAAFDLHRARQWTVALDRWCDDQPGLVAFRGSCLVHRAHLMQLGGDWADAVGEAETACSLLSGHPAAGEASYRLGELHRLRGEYEQAECCFLEASRWIADPQPGLALLWLRQGRADDAATAVRTALDQAANDLDRCRLLPGYVEIMLEVGRLDAAREAATELVSAARASSAPWLVAMGAQAAGACSLAERDGSAGLRTLRGAWAAWRELDAPYESARVRVLMAEAHRILGDRASAEMELEAAGWVFDRLGAMPDLERVRRLSARAAPAGPLTGREVEVLRLVATGMTNRAIASELFLSEKTVARHLSNIFVKLHVSSRAAATAYAYQHDLVPSHPTR
ncbi:putative LuxR family transcriptional regulator [Microlunatus phosphovorus NM-1]|uniref:Putative LuxR family transcriptional regulator n=1 Tax=Microlunatus phosphovorus (strain ATCC 700054 / DSM 10555 / JCM 9379 / NBRC 101784 / NCIMB 13414 / VKM Ac-1990 / NM-1) TaxID=1032480 RepID=F5XM51_MICPN|nr:response regulator transcription factor [Microlunatus phosphovorus]BAK36308.1 putative LuxR family transcriptional regulator [Microlunatus phosphovorus NM-1]